MQFHFLWIPIEWLKSEGFKNISPLKVKKLDIWIWKSENISENHVILL